jgi:hypothetical protein
MPSGLIPKPRPLDVVVYSCLSPVCKHGIKEDVFDLLGTGTANFRTAQLDIRNISVQSYKNFQYGEDKKQNYRGKGASCCVPEGY